MAEFSALIDRLVDWLVEPIGRAGVRKSEIKSLRADLALLNGLIDDAEARLEEEDALKIWVKQLREAAELSVKVLDEYVIFASPPRSFVNYLNRTGRLIGTLFSCHNMSERVAGGGAGDVDGLVQMLVGVKLGRSAVEDSASTSVLRSDAIAPSSSSIDRFSVFSDDIED